MTPFDLRAAIPTGTALVEAGAGTGKTYTIATLVTRIVLEEATTIDQALVVTYTEAATAELKERIRQRLAQTLRALDDGASDDDLLAALVARVPDRDVARNRLVAALASFDEAAVFTIHGFCRRVLADHAIESGESFSAELVPDLSDLHDEVVADFWARELGNADPLLVRVLREQKVTPSLLASLLRLVNAHPDVRVLPDAPEAWVPGARERFEEAVDGARKIWRDERGDIVRLITTSPALNRNSYRPASIEKWAARLDDVFAREPGRVLLAREILERFTTERLANGTKKNCETPNHVFFLCCQQLVNAIGTYSETLRRESIALLRRFVVDARAELARRKRQLGVLSFDDLLQRLDVALRGTGGETLVTAVRTRYRAALVDEFQDTDPVQYRILERLFGGRRLLLIGDPKQSIYAFRGADVFAYLRAARRTDVKRHTLGVNWRSAPNLVTAVNLLFLEAARPFLVDDIEFRGARAAPISKNAFTRGERDPVTGAASPTAPLEFLLLPGYATDAEKFPVSKSAFGGAVTDGIAAEIAELLRGPARLHGKPVRPRDVAVLVRTNAEASAVQFALRECGVPGVVHGAASVFASETAAELLEVLHAVQQPGRASLVRGAATTSLLGRDADALEHLTEDDAAFDALLAQFRVWNDTWVRHGFVRAVRRMQEDEEVPHRLLALPDGQRRLTDLRHLTELLHRAETSGRLGPAGLARWLARQIEGASDTEETQLRLETDAEAVQILTVHRSKGLEFEIVYCPFLWRDARLSREEEILTRFHDPAEHDRFTLDIGSNDHATHRELAAGEALAEGLRLLYVALTRARQACTVVWGAVRGAHASALAYLLHGGSTTGDPGRAKMLVAAALKDLDEGQLHARVLELAAESGGAIGARIWEPQTVEPLASDAATGPRLRVRTLRRPISAAWRIASFSQMTAEASALPVAVEGLHRDADAARADGRVSVSDGGAQQIPLHDFPRGARPGTAVHAVLEHADYASDDVEALTTVARTELGRHGIDAERWAAPLADALLDVLATPLGGGDDAPRLRDLGPGARLHELGFLFPVTPAVASAETHAEASLTSRDLADVFRAHASHLPPAVAQRIERLGFTPLTGYLRGFVDLIYEHAGRWSLVDFKSNHLGDTTADYAEPRMRESMVEGDYYLQAHLYALALHRYLATRVPQYDYDTHFGAVQYLFVRGMGPANAAGGTGAAARPGVLTERPSRAMIEALDALVGRVAGAVA